MTGYEVVPSCHIPGRFVVFDGENKVLRVDGKTLFFFTELEAKKRIKEVVETTKEDAKK